MMETNRDLVKEAMIDYWGEKCPEFENDCGCCIAWKQFEELKARITG